MPWIISPWNGKPMEVTADSILLRSNAVIPNPNAAPTTVTPVIPVIGTQPSPVVTTVSQTTVASVSITQSEENKRREIVKTLGFSPIPAVAAIQKRNQEIYIKTGKWDDSLTKEADRIRKGLNPLSPEGQRGATDSQYFLPGSGEAQPNVSAVGSLFDGLSGLFGKTANTAGDAAGQAAKPGNSGTIMLLLGGSILFLMFGRRR